MKQTAARILAITALSFALVAPAQALRCHPSGCGQPLPWYAGLLGLILSE